MGLVYLGSFAQLKIPGSSLERAQWVKCFLCKFEDLSSDLQDSIFFLIVRQSNELVTSKWGDTDRQKLGVHCPASLAQLVSSSQRDLFFAILFLFLFF